jgi:hypothetical protein
LQFVHHQIRKYQNIDEAGGGSSGPCAITPLTGDPTCVVGEVYGDQVIWNYYPTGSSSIYIHIDHRRLDVGAAHRSHDGSGNCDHLDLIFPVYLKLMTGFPSFQPEDVEAELLNTLRPTFPP